MPKAGGNFRKLEPSDADVAEDTRLRVVDVVAADIYERTESDDCRRLTASVVEARCSCWLDGCRGGSFGGGPSGFTLFPEPAVTVLALLDTLAVRVGPLGIGGGARCTASVDTVGTAGADAEDGMGGGGRRAAGRAGADGFDAADGVVGAGFDELKFFCLLSAAIRSASVLNCGSSTSAMMKRGYDEDGGRKKGGISAGMRTRMDITMRSSTKSPSRTRDTKKSNKMATNKTSENQKMAGNVTSRGRGGEMKRLTLQGGVSCESLMSIPPTL